MEKRSGLYLKKYWTRGGSSVNIYIAAKTASKQNRTEMYKKKYLTVNEKSVKVMLVAANAAKK